MREHDRSWPARRRHDFDDDDSFFTRRRPGAAALSRDRDRDRGYDPRREPPGGSDRAAGAEPWPDGTGDDPPGDGDRWSTWDTGCQGPPPYPEWLVTELGAVDTELGVLKTGKEAEVYLVRRGVPGTGPSCLLAAKRYRTAEHRLFHRDAGYLEGRRVRRSRETRAMAQRTSFGRDILAGQWAAAEFAALCRLWELGAESGLEPIVPYPVQQVGTEVLLEFLDDGDGAAAPRLAQTRPAPGALADLWRQLLDEMMLLARAGYTHGDLSAYNILVYRGRPVLIDLPQIVDVVQNPQGPAFLARDVGTIVAWFTARGLPGLDPAAVTEDLLATAGIR